MKRRLRRLALVPQKWDGASDRGDNGRGVPARSVLRAWIFSFHAGRSARTHE